MGNSIWDDPEWNELRNRVDSRDIPRALRKQKRPQMVVDGSTAQKAPKTSENAPKETKKVNVSVNLSIPRVKLPKVSKKQLKIGLTSFVILGISIGASFFIINRNKTADPTDVLLDVEQKPGFDTVLPSGKEDETTSGKVGYDPEKKVASFTDTIGTTKITVSQQELPEPFKASTDEEVRKLAEGFSATEVINESNPKAYLGNDVAGPQTVIFHKNGLLIFILSEKPVEKAQWAEYITKLL